MLIQRHMSIGSLITAFLTKRWLPGYVAHAYFKKQLPFRSANPGAKVMKAIEAAKVYHA